MSVLQTNGDDRFKFLCTAEEIAAGKARRIVVESIGAVAVYNLDGTFYVTADQCTHGKALLSRGKINGDVVECPFHLGQFNIRTGAVVAGPCTVPLKTYSVVVNNGKVLLDAEINTA